MLFGYSGMNITLQTLSRPITATSKNDLPHVTQKPVPLCALTEPDATLMNHRTTARLDVSAPPSEVPTHIVSDASPDSGYLSLEPTPHTNKAILSSGQGLTAYNKPIPDEIRNRFLDIRILYTQPLWDAITRKRKGDPGDISMKLKYMGENEENVQLYIVIQCEKRVSKRVKTFFARKHVLEDLRPDFRVYVIDKGLLRLVNPEKIGVLGNLEDSRRTLCGTSIEMTTESGSRLATLGGLIMIKATESTIYGFTAGHPLENAGDDSSSQPLLWDEDETDSEDDSTDDEFEPGPLANTDRDFSDPQNLLSPEPKTDIGRVVTNSFPLADNESNHDWALIELSHKDWAPNCLGHWPETYGSVSDQKIWVRESKATPRSSSTLALVPCSPGLEVYKPEQSVVAITSRGLQKGTLTSNCSSLMMFPGRTFVQTFEFLPNPGSKLAPGDSGSWVANETTGELYGHVVSTDAFGEACVMPIQSTLLEIQFHLGAQEVCLPTEKEISTLRKFRENASMRDNSPENLVYWKAKDRNIQEWYSQLDQPSRRKKEEFEHQDSPNNIRTGFEHGSLSETRSDIVPKPHHDSVSLSSAISQDPQAYGSGNSYSELRSKNSIPNQSIIVSSRPKHPASDYTFLSNIAYQTTSHAHQRNTSSPTRSSYSSSDRSSHRSSYSQGQTRSSVASTNTTWSEFSASSEEQYGNQLEFKLDATSAVTSPSPSAAFGGYTIEPPFQTCVSRKKRSRSSQQQCRYWCTSCEEGFKEKYDWKRHEETYQEWTEIFECELCENVYFLDKDFVHHHQKSHRCRVCAAEKQHVERARKTRLARSGWGCGFCSHFSNNWAERCNHISKHFEKEKKTMYDWHHTQVIWSLLQRPEILGHWCRLLEVKHRTGTAFRWRLHDTGRVKGFPESNVGPQLQDLLEYYNPESESPLTIIRIAFDKGLREKELPSIPEEDREPITGPPPQGAYSQTN